ncbi:MAG: hypothetical protein H8E41_04345 [Desulfobulbaceae bacterium]|uniref:Uncharacterized protein n=1 Tax=Candidatus Desulfobia pelagia TaxID=2841692 RepID=A0A8J6NCI8_9BACT|nr:hypothetical protein [Candidatus Desulfobia pelagia]
MTPADLIPVADTIPVHWLWFQVLLTVTFFFHMVAMNVMAGTAVIALVTHIRGGDASLPLCRDLAKKIPFFIAFTVNFGVAPLLFVQVLYGHFMYTSSVLMASFWLSVIILLIIAYGCTYLYDFKFDELFGSRALILSIAVTLFFVIAFLFTNNFSLMQVPETWSRYFNNSQGTMLNLGDPTLIPRYLHMMISAVAVGGLAIALYYDFIQRRGREIPDGRIQLGCQWFSAATCLNFVIGFLFLDSLPDAVKDVSTASGLFFVISLIGGIVSGGFSIVLGFVYKVRQTAIAAFCALVFMVLVREAVRITYLKPYFNVTELQVVPQYSPLLLFLVVFAAGIAVFCYMLKLAFQVGEVKS